MPLEYVGTCIAIFTFAQNLGILLSALMALVFPDDDDEEALAENETWRIVFGLPMAMYGLMMIGLLLFVKYDSPKFYMSADDR